MDVIIIDSEAYFKLLDEQTKFILSKLKEYKKDSIGEEGAKNEWLTLEEAQKILPYRSKTKWQSLRDNGEIVFAQFGRKLLYNRSSLLKYIKINAVE